MIVLRNPAFVLASALVLTACGAEQQAQDDAAPPEAETEPASGMAGMEGMEDGMMSQMTTHMQMMDGASGDSIQSMLPMHRQMAANMLAQMNREMRDMNMTTDEAWNATVDSVRQDLRGMPEMSASELEAAMPGHHARMMRLMEMHRSMMSDMQM